MKNIKLSVLALFGATILSAGLFSCSNDNETNEPENSTVENTTTTASRPIISDELDVFYYNYYNSDEYNVYSSSVNLFYSKLKTFKPFNNENELLDWVSLNLDSTDFTSLQEVENSLNLMDTNYFKLHTKFPEFESNFINLKIEVISDKIDKWFPGQSYVQTTGSCYSDLKDCRKQASDTYAEKALALVKEGGHDNSTTSRKKSEINKEYSNAVDGCIKTYENCNG